MEIHGFNRTTLLDYPEHVAATVFTGGCNFRCPFCQNGGLVLCPGEQALVAEEEVLAHLKKRRGILEGLCITGGEPTLQPDLGDFIGRVKALGYAVKLDTNGYRPEVLRGLLDRGLLDYVAMDIKASPENYANVTGVSGFEAGKVEESVGLLKGGDIPYEFRTTAVKGLHSVEEFGEIGKWLAGSRAYFIQSYRDGGEILGRLAAENTCPGVLPPGDGRTGSGAEEAGPDTGPAGVPRMEEFSPEELREAARLAGRYIQRVELRGVE